MADLSSLSLSDLATALTERCTRPQDLQLIQSKIDMAIAGMCQSDAVTSKAHADIREEIKDTQAAVFNRIGDSEARSVASTLGVKDALNLTANQLSREHSDITSGQCTIRSGIAESARETESKLNSVQDFLSGEHAQLDDKIHNSDAKAAGYFYDTQSKVQDTKFQLHDNIVRQGTDIATNFGLVQKSVAENGINVALATEKVGNTISRDMTNIGTVLGQKLNDMQRDAAACCCETQKEIGKTAMVLEHDIHNSQNHIERDIDRSERWLERESRYQFDQARNEARDFRGEVLAAQAQAAKDAALCCCETAGLIRDTKTEITTQATANFNALNLQAVTNQSATIKAICDLSHDMDKQFCALNTKDIQRDLEAKQAALVEAKNEISNLRQTQALIDALGRKERA